ncbi:MAG: hypothetical protein WA359_05850 [Acidimicrobiales bacterium]
MKKSHLIALVAIGPFMFVTLAQAAPVTRTAPPFVDGFYSIKGTDTTTVDAELTVADNGKLIVGGLRGSGVSCSPSATAEADGAELTLSFYFPRSIPISASGSFSYTGEVIATAEQNELSTNFDGTATLSGHFIKGKIVAHVTNALIGTFSSPSMCAASTPTRVIDQWDITDK